MKKGSFLLTTPLLLLLVPLAAPAQTPINDPAEATRPRRVGPSQPSAAGAAETTQAPLPAQQQTAPRPTPPTPAPPAPATSSPASPAQTPPSTITAPQNNQTATPPAPASPAATVTPQVALPLTLDKIYTRLAEAQRLLKTRPAPTALTTSPATPPIDFVTIAALEPATSKIHTVTLAKQTFLTKGAEVTMTTSLGSLVRLNIVRPNYVNTAVTITDTAGRHLVPLLVEYPIEKRRVFREMAYYTSAHPALLSPELVRSGQTYVRTMLDAAASRLRDKGIIIQPAIVDVAERLCLVEHVDHDRFNTENRRALYEEIYALYGLNQQNTYNYSVSTAGAGGMVQMIPWTYNLVRQRYPGVGLIPDFVAGMRNHVNALQAMLLYMRDTWTDLALNETIIEALVTKTATQAELLAAGYNSNPARLPLYIQRGGAAWRTLLPRETQIYLQIYSSVESLIPMKARETKPSGETKTPAVAAGQ